MTSESRWAKRGRLGEPFSLDWPPATKLSVMYFAEGDRPDLLRADFSFLFFLYERWRKGEKEREKRLRLKSGNKSRV